MGRTKKARNPSSQYDKKRSSSKQQSPPNIGELEISPATSPALLEKQEQSPLTNPPQKVTQTGSSYQVPRLSQISDDFEDGIDESDLYDIDLNWDRPPKPGARKTKAIPWSEADSTTRRSSPARETETSGPDIWQFGENHSTGLNSSPKAPTEGPEETIPLSQSQGQESAAQINEKAGRQIDFSETATTNHRSSPFGLSEGPGQQPWEFDASSAAAMSTGRRNSELPDTLPIEAENEATRATQVLAEEIESDEVSSNCYLTQKLQKGHARDSGVNLTTRQPGLQNTGTEHTPSDSQDDDCQETSGSEFVPPGKSKTIARKGKSKKRSWKTEPAPQTSTKRTTRAKRPRQTEQLMNEEPGTAMASTLPDKEKTVSKSKRPKQRPKAPLRFDSSTQQLWEPTQAESVETSSSGQGSPPAGLRLHDSPASENISDPPEKAVKTTRAAAGTANEQRGSTQTLQGSRKPQSSDLPQTRSQKKAVAVPFELNSEGNNCNTRLKDLVAMHSGGSDKEDDSGSAPVDACLTPQSQAQTSASPRAVPGISTQSPLRRNEPKEDASPKTTNKQKKRNIAQIQEVASSFRVTHKSDAEDDAPNGDSNIRAKKPKQNNEANLDALPQMLTPGAGGSIISPPDYKHRDVANASSNIRITGNTRVCATSLIHDGIGLEAASHVPDIESEEVMRTALSPRDANSISRHTKQDVFKGRSTLKTQKSDTGSSTAETKRGLSRPNRQISVSDLGSPLLQQDNHKAQRNVYISGPSSGSLQKIAHRGGAGHNLLHSEQSSYTVKALAQGGQAKGSGPSGGLGRVARKVVSGEFHGAPGNDLRHKLLDDFCKQARQSERHSADDRDTGSHVQSNRGVGTGDAPQIEKASPITVRLGQLSKRLAIHLESLEEPVYNIPRVYADKSERCLIRIQGHFTHERLRLLKQCEQDTQQFHATLARTLEEANYVKQSLSEGSQQIQAKIGDRLHLLSQVADRLTQIHNQKGYGAA